MGWGGADADVAHETSDRSVTRLPRTVRLTNAGKLGSYEFLQCVDFFAMHVPLGLTFRIAVALVLPS